MRNLSLLIAIAALLFVSALTWKADASVSSGAANLAIAAKNFTPIIKAGCGGRGPHCTWGRHWFCGQMGRCWCAPC
jgi:hypothetical protein